MILFYLIGFVVASVLLAAWFYAQEREAPVKQIRRGFWVALAIYAIGVIWSVAPVDFKAKTIFRDLMILAASGVFFMIFFKLKRFLAVAIMIWGVGMMVYLRKEMMDTFPYSNNIPLTLNEDGELLVELKEGVKISALESLLEKYDLSAERAFYPESPGETILDNYYMVDIPNDKLSYLPQIKSALNNSRKLEWLEENEIIQVAPLESAQKLSPIQRKYNLNDPGIENLWSFQAMEMDKLFNYLRSNNIQPRKDIMIAILDTGVDAKHEDIQANYTSTKTKYDVDKRGHGTHCAGIAGAVSNNALGIASYAPNNDFVQLTSIKVLSDGGFGTQSSIINGMIEAADRGASVLSMSLGGRSNQSKQRAYERAVKYAQKKGAIVLASAGNSNDNAKFYAPANSDGLISVSALDPNLNRASFSNRVTDLKMGIAAPGVSIYSTIPNNRYDSYNGTSMACPYVAGLVGIMKAINPELTSKEVYDILKRTGKETKDTKATGKLIFPYQAVKAVVERQ